jgi:hypothetical protein
MIDLQKESNEKVSTQYKLHDRGQGIHSMTLLATTYLDHRKHGKRSCLYTSNNRMEDFTYHKTWLSMNFLA